MWLLLILGVVLIVLAWALTLPLTIERLMYGIGVVLVVIAVIMLVLGALGTGGSGVEIDSLRQFVPMSL